MRLNGLDLFSGIGGNTLALRDYIKTIAYCEADRHAQSVLLSRMVDGLIEPAPIWNDICTLKGTHFNIEIDIIIGGFPCQDISVAGTGKGLGGERSGLFFEILRLAKEIKPTFLFLENVAAIRTRGLETIVREFSDLGYDCRWCSLSASQLGALHKRQRWFLLAYAGNQRLQGLCSTERVQTEHSKFNRTTITNIDLLRVERAWAEFQTTRSDKSFTYDGSVIEPSLVRGVHGISCQVDRIKRLGNAVVPTQAKKAFEYLLGLNEHD